MSNWPTLSRTPNKESFSQTLSTDPSLVSETENGYQITRNKFANVAIKFEMVYSFITSAEKDTLEAFEKTVGYRAESFFWVNPSDLLTYEVRFTENLTFRLERALGFWNVGVKFIEVRPNTAT